MMRIDLISAVPQVLESPLNHSIIKKAQDASVVEIVVHDLRSFTKDKHRKIDDYPYGGGAGMVLTPQPIFDAIRYLQKQRSYDAILYTAPDGKPFHQKDANRLSTLNNVIILCGHYKGVDERVRQTLISEEYSIGDYVLSGGELPALVMVDAIVRLLPGAIGDAESALEDSFQSDLLGPPVFTRPAHYEGLDVPEVLLQGNHKAIQAWREQEALNRTKERRPDIFNQFNTET